MSSCLSFQCSCRGASPSPRRSPTGPRVANTHQPHPAPPPPGGHQPSSHKPWAEGSCSHPGWFPAQLLNAISPTCASPVPQNAYLGFNQDGSNHTPYPSTSPAASLCLMLQLAGPHATQIHSRTARETSVLTLNNKWTRALMDTGLYRVAKLTPLPPSLPKRVIFVLI